VVIVTGTGGIGFQDALALAGAGAEVIIAGRNRTKGEAAVARVLAQHPAALVSFESVDLTHLDSVRAFAARMRSQLRRLDVLINNAAVMAPPARQMTRDGFELQLQTNYLAPYVLTEGLLPLLRATQGARLVTVSSIGARGGTIDFDNLQGEKSYQARALYAQSKLADLLFAQEFHRRSVAEGWGVTSVAAHPGLSRTDLIMNGQGFLSIPGLLRYTLFLVLFQSAAQGALPTLYAATSPGAQAGAYYGSGPREIRGLPSEAVIPPLALDPDLGRRLWDTTAALVGAQWGGHRG